MNAPRQKRIPDGEGGWKLVEAVGDDVKVDISQEKVQDRLQKAQEGDFFLRVGECTQSLNKFLEIYANDHDLSPEEVMAAVYLENLNNREFYPGGTEKYDTICKDIWAWFQENK